MPNKGVFSFVLAAGTVVTPFGVNAFSDPLPPDLTYRPLPMQPFSEVKMQDEAMKPAVPATVGQVFPQRQIDEIAAQERRDLKRFDVDFDLPDHLTPEFPPPIFLTTHPELGDVKAQIVDHQKTAQLLAWEIGSGEDAQFQRFAADILPKVLRHPKAAQTIHSELTGAAIR